MDLAKVRFVRIAADLLGESERPLRVMNTHSMQGPRMSVPRWSSDAQSSAFAIIGAGYVFVSIR